MGGCLQDACVYRIPSPRKETEFMMELWLYCKACRACHPADDKTCDAAAQDAQGSNRQEDISTQPLLHNRYQSIGQLETRCTGNVTWGKDLLTDNAIVVIKEIALSTLAPRAPQTTTGTPSAMPAGLQHYLHQLGALHHSGLPRVRDMFSENEQFYMIIDYIDGKTLEEYCLPEARRLAQTGSRPLPVKEVLDIGIQLCSLLSYLHQQSPAITVKAFHPSTLIRSANGHISFIGLYTSASLQAQTQQQSSPARAKQRGYYAPELSRPSHTQNSATVQSDIYSLGVLLHQLYTGYDPNESPYNFAPLRTFHNPALEALDHLIRCMVQIKCEQRPHSIHEVEYALCQIQRGYAIAHAEIIEAISPYEAALDTPQLTIVKDSTSTKQWHRLQKQHSEIADSFILINKEREEK